MLIDDDGIFHRSRLFPDEVFSVFFFVTSVKAHYVIFSQSCHNLLFVYEKYDNIKFRMNFP